jgi:hypothetical protein
VLIKITNVKWHGTNVVKKMKFGGLGLVDPSEAKNALLLQWIMHAFEPSDSNLKSLLRYCLNNFQPRKGGKQLPNLKWHM